MWYVEICSITVLLNAVCQEHFQISKVTSQVSKEESYMGKAGIKQSSVNCLDQSQNLTKSITAQVPLIVSN